MLSCSSVATALTPTGGKDDLKLQRLLDSWTIFDLLNVQNFSAGARARKPFQQPYRSADDFRLAVMY